MDRHRDRLYDQFAKAAVRLGIALLLILVAGAGVYYAIPAYCFLLERHVRYVYDQQKKVVDSAIEEFVNAIESERARVSNNSKWQGGSGDWRTTAIILAEHANGDVARCRVEIQGFVSHNAADQPIWTKNLPMTIKAHGQELDSRFVDLLVLKIKSRGWDYEFK